MTIAKVDATANDVPEEIQGFPTIKLYPANSKTAVDYSGARTVEDLAAFVRDNGSNRIDVYTDADEDMVDADDVAASAAAALKAAGGAKTEDMQHQAPAATPDSAAQKIAQAAGKVADAVIGEDTDDHDEL